jgi:Zn/Cd-binding protein ZinT
MIARHLLSIILPLFTFVACGANSTEPEEAPFETWEGTWQAAEPMYRDDAITIAYQGIHDLRPEYSVEEIQGLFIATADVDYTSLRVESNTLTFLRGTKVICSARYHAATADGVSDAGAAAGPESYTDFKLVDATGGDCAQYNTVSLTGLLDAESPDHHFHIITKTKSGPLFPPPWNPSVWTPSTTASSFAEMFLAAAPAIAGSLPAR